MKRLMILATIALLAVGTTGCGGRQWGRWWNRGAFCWPQAQQSFSPPVEVYEEGAVIHQGPAPPPGLPALPGPAATAPGQ